LTASICTIPISICNRPSKVRSTAFRDSSNASFFLYGAICAASFSNSASFSALLPGTAARIDSNGAIRAWMRITSPESGASSRDRSNASDSRADVSLPPIAA
jgi:hypothetical protein